MISSLSIKGFTVFQNASFDFVPGINVLVGANASGKTHVMKLLYAMQRAQADFNLSMGQWNIIERLLGVFRPENPNDLVNNTIKPQIATVAAEWNSVLYEFALQAGSKGKGDNFVTGNGARWQNMPLPVFIPAKDMLANSIGFISLYDQRNIDFDEISRDILSLAFTPTLRAPARTAAEPLLKVISDRLGGEVEVEGERFYLSGRGHRFEMHLVAEGWRKMALLYQLIANGSISEGSVLYWDEPEANLNPSMMDDLVGVLYALARNGTQIFLATHSYIILKELELQKREEDSLRIFAMAKNEKVGSVTPHPAASYAELSPNLIASQFERIYDLEIDRVIGGANG